MKRTANPDWPGHESILGEPYWLLVLRDLRAHAFLAWVLIVVWWRQRYG